MPALPCDPFINRLRLLAVPALLVCAGATHADYPTEVMNTAGLIGYWRFEFATQADSSVNGYGGTFLGNAAVGDAGSGPSFVDVPDNRALLLDGDGDGVSTNLAGQVTFPTAATIAAWVYLDIQPSAAGHILYIAGRSTGGDDLDLQIDTNDRLRFYTDGGGNMVTAPAPLPLHQWVMVAGIFGTATSTRVLFVDGRPVASDAPGPHVASASPFTLGYSPLFPGRWFKGRIDEVAIFERALSGDEIRHFEDAAGDLVFRSGFDY